MSEQRQEQLWLDGVERLHGTKFRIGPDRNEIVTFAIAAVITEGEVFIKDINRHGLEEFLDVLKKLMGDLRKRKRNQLFLQRSFKSD